VKVGDTFESIAAACSQNYGVPVAPNDIRRKNQGRDLVEGVQLTVPLRSTTVRPVTQQTLQQVAALEPPVNPVGDATVSNEVALPVAKMAAPSQPPMYQAPNMARVETPQPERRGPSVLASRGFMPSPDGMRVLEPHEDAPNTNPALKDAPPQARVTQPPKSKSNLAQVARIAKTGGNIRRLPEASAVSLYRCPVGTELAVIRQQGAWSAILMSDRSTGWIPTRYLRMLSASVDISTQVLDNTKMDRSDGYSSGNFSSNNPMVQHALAWLGTRYSYGGTGRHGIDCSALVQNSFASCGYRLPRTAAEQSRVGQAVDPSDLRAGDRLYFSASGSRIDHTGLYMGNGQFVHASGRGRCVMVSNLFEPHNWNIFVGARR
jgi:cell wall-associated NlpC family hydrolase